MSRQKNKYCAPLDKSRNKGLPNVRSSVAVKGWELEKIITTPMNRMDFLCMYYKADPENIPRELSNHYNEARYHGINFHPMYSNFGTVEIRYHEGTLDAKDFLHWVAFHQHIVDNSRIMRESDSLMLFHIKGPKTRLRRYAEMTKMPQYLLDYACKRIDKFKS
jgi:hypothetical protein